MQESKVKISFSEKVLEVAKTIPRGSTLTYKEVAIRAGSPRAYRAVGSVLAKNYNLTIPCHRVICSNGSVGHYNRGDKEKLKKLTKEGAIT